MYGYFDKSGTRIEAAEYLELSCDFNYKRIAYTELPSGKVVSTVWLGLDHGSRNGKPLIFETMVFPSSTEFSDLAHRRYSSEEDALNGHKEIVDIWGEV